MKRFHVALLTLLFLSTAHCGDDGDSSAGAEEDVCENGCVNEFGKNEKKLCPEPQSEWNCVEGCCVPVFKCATDDDCAEQGFVEGQCQDDRYACRCDVDTNSCYEWLCASNDECSDGEVCDAGACVSVSDALSLRIVRRAWVLSPGATGQLLVEAYDPASPDLGLSADVTWSSDDATVVSVDETGQLTGGDVAGTTRVGAQFADGDRVDVEILNIVAEESAALTLVAHYERSHEPVTGNYAVVSADQGTILAKGAIPEDGVISLTDGGDGTVDVHLFADQGDWVSWLGATADGSILFMPIPRTLFGDLSITPELALDAEETILDGANVFQGIVDFGDYDKEGEIDLTLSSLAFSSGLFDFSLETLLGPNVNRFFDAGHSLPGVSDTDTAEVPGGLTFSLGTPALPQFHLAAGPGSHRVWTLGGRISMEQVAPVADQLFDAFGGSSLDFGMLVGTLFPSFADFWSGMVMTPNVEGDEAMSVLPLETKLTVPLGLSSSVSTGLLPAMDELGVADAVFILAGALTPDLLFVPLGLNADTDTRDPETDPPDRRIDSDDATPEIDPLNVAYAPLHSGLGGPHGRYAVAVVAAAVPGEDDPRPDGGSAILLRYAAGQEPPAAIDAPDFLAFPMDSSWDPETRALAIGDVEGAPVQRVLFKHKHGRHWTLWLNGRTEYTLPLPQDVAPDGVELEDRSATIHLVLVNSFDLADGLSADALVRTGGMNLDGLLDAVDRASFVDIRP